MKKGTFQAMGLDGASVESTYNAWYIEDGTEKILILQHTDSNGAARVNMNVEPDGISSLVGRPGNSNPKIVWVSPLTEVPGTGCGNALDVYPVGIEITTTDTAFNPMKVWGGTWTVTPAGAKRVWKRTA